MDGEPFAGIRTRSPRERDPGDVGAHRQHPSRSTGGKSPGVVGGDDQSRYPGRISWVDRRGNRQFRPGCRGRIDHHHGWAGQALTLSAWRRAPTAHLDPPVVENYTNDGSRFRRTRRLSRPPDSDRGAVHSGSTGAAISVCPTDRPGGRGAAAGQQPERRRAARLVDRASSGRAPCSARAGWSTPCSHAHVERGLDAGDRRPGAIVSRGYVQRQPGHRPRAPSDSSSAATSS